METNCPKMKLYNQFFQDTLFERFADYVQCDAKGIYSMQAELPYGEYFENHDYKEFPVLKKSNLHDLVQFLRSMSFYRAFWIDNENEIQNGTVEDPVALFAARILKEENLTENVTNIDLNDKNNVKSMIQVDIDVLWTFYVHILSNERWRMTYSTHRLQDFGCKLD